MGARPGRSARAAPPFYRGCVGWHTYDRYVTARIGIRGAVVAGIVLLLAAVLSSAAGARRDAPVHHVSTAAGACVRAGGAYDDRAWRAPEDAFGGFSCTFVTFDGPSALAGFSPALRRTIDDACSRSAGTPATIATFTYVGYGCIWAR